MNSMTRRDFLGTTLAGAGAMIAAPAWAKSETKADSPSSATDRIELGKTGIKASRIAMGTGANGYRRSSDQTRLGQEKFTKLIRHGIDSGLNFIDMADLYGSHSFMKNVLKEVKRDQLVLLSKVWFAGGGDMPKTDAARPEVERFLKELGTDHLDICLMHCLTDTDWPSHRKQMMDELSEMRQKGMVRAVGCSCHDLGALKTAAQNPWVDVIFARINNKQKKMDGMPEVIAAVLKEARKNGKAVVGMKIYGCGDLLAPEEQDASIRYVWGNQLVDAMTIGFTDPAQTDDTIQNLNKVLKA